MNIRTLHVIIVLLIVSIASGYFGYFLGTNKVSIDWKQYRPKVAVHNQAPPVGTTDVDFAQFWNVWQRIEASYYDKKAINHQKMLNGAIAGMVESLEDPYTVYLPPVQNSDFKQGMAGKFEGIGAELGMKGKQIIVVAPLDGMPAQKAGIRAGDAIVKVDNQSTAGWTLSQAVEKIRGPKGSSVQLTLLRKDVDKPQELQVMRDTITVKTVVGWIKPVAEVEAIDTQKFVKEKKEKEVIAYIRLSQFGDNTNQEWVPMVNSVVLKMQQQKEVKGLILDMRNNPGGYLTDATFIASEFIPYGETVVKQEKGTGETITFDVTRKGLLQDIPIIVLMNKGSASASEIVAGALRDHGRAKLLGDTSFGKGTIQQAEDLGSGSGLHVTIAKWLTPKGVWVHGKGLEPDIKVDVDTKDTSHDIQLERAIEELIK